MQSATAKLNILELIWQAGPVVKLVMLLLFCMSVLSVTIILFKYLFIKRVHRENGAFLRFFWEAETLEAVFGARDRFRDCPMARVFMQAYREFKAAADGNKVDNVERLLRGAVLNELAMTERLIPFLAITASSAPFIGLFGTVWGIMDAFLNIGAKGSTSLAVVAPGIAEALIATAIGLFAAIPAAIFYNLLVTKVRGIRREYENFANDLINVMTRGRGTKGGGKPSSESIKYEMGV